jgi:hypothetical protein
LPAILLLIGMPEVRALAAVLDRTDGDRHSFDPRDLARMANFIDSGMLKDRGRAALIGATAAESFSETELARVSAAIFSAFLPGSGTEIGALLGDSLAESHPAGRTARTRGAIAKEKAQ